MKKIQTMPVVVSYQPKYELCKIKWEINPYDADKNKNWSIPHGDDIYPRHHTLKLNVYNGVILTARGKKYYGHLKKAELERLHSDEQFKRVVELAKEKTGTSRFSSFHTKTYVFEALCLRPHLKQKRRQNHVTNSRHHKIRR